MDRIANSRIRENGQEYKVPKILQYLFLIYILLKPFYIFESGSFQPSDAVFLLSFLVFLYFNGSVNLIHCKFDIILCVFVLFTFVINVLYFLLYRYTEFLYSSSYYLFNLMVVLVARVLLMDRGFIRKLFWTCRICLYLQVAIYFLGLGKYYVDLNVETNRYLGTFNDPNQLGFYMFAALMIMFMIEKFSNIKCKVNILDYAAVIFVLFLTASIGLMLALAVFVVSYVLILPLSLTFEQDFKMRRRVVIILVIMLLLAVIFVIFKDQIIPLFEGSYLYDRLLAKDGLSVSVDDPNYEGLSIWEERNIDKLYLYPQYNIFGAGQGYFARFVGSRSVGEIHSTLLSVIFCYGIIPTAFFLLWIWKNIRKTFYFIPVFLAIAAESFFLLNQRQPLFWLIFLLSYSYRIMEEKKDEDAFYT